MPVPALAILIVVGALAPDRPSKLADTYVEAVSKVNASHLAKPKSKTESDLAKRLPKKGTRALGDLLALEDGEGLAASLGRCARAALDLDRMDDFQRCKEAMARLDEEASADLGNVVSRKRFIVRGEGGLSVDYVDHFADVVDDILGAYDEVFGFAELSKVPGKKVRIRVHLEDKITRPPHFAPQYPWHSEVDFPVIDPDVFRSPTADGKFLFYGLCHEIGHVVAMWGDPLHEEDHHAWAHYTGVVVVEHLAGLQAKPKWLVECRDVRWRSMAMEIDRLNGCVPGTEDRDAVLSLLFALHDEAGPEAIGAAINALDAEDKRRRFNSVRYYTFEQLSKALAAGSKDRKLKKRLRELFSD